MSQFFYFFPLTFKLFGHEHGAEGWGIGDVSLGVGSDGVNKLISICKLFNTILVIPFLPYPSLL